MDLGLAGRTALVRRGFIGARAGIGRGARRGRMSPGDRGRAAEAGLDTVAADLRERHGLGVVVLEGDAAEAGHRRADRGRGAGRLGPHRHRRAPAPVARRRSTRRRPTRRAGRRLPAAVDHADRAGDRAAHGMRSRHWGRVVSILSSGVRQPITDLVYSNAARGALAAWLKATARTVAADGVTVNGVLPGRIQTPPDRACWTVMTGQSGPARRSRRSVLGAHRRDPGGRAMAGRRTWPPTSRHLCSGRPAIGPGRSRRSTAG